MRGDEEQITALEGRLREEKSRCDQLELELEIARAAMVAQQQEQEKSNKDKGKGLAVVETLNVIVTGMHIFNSNFWIKLKEKVRELGKLPF